MSLLVIVHDKSGRIISTSMRVSNGNGLAELHLGPCPRCRFLVDIEPATFKPTGKHWLRCYV